MNGKLFVFEGPDNVGKSSTIRGLSKRLMEKGIDNIICAFPGNNNGTLGKVIYDIHHNPQKYGIIELNPNSKQLLHVAAHVETIEAVIMPAIKNGKIVLLDRYWWSTWVYGLESNVDSRLLSKMIKIEMEFWKSIKPSTVFLLRRNLNNDYTEISNNLNVEYETLAKKEERLYKVIRVHNNSSMESLVNQIEKEILNIIDYKKRLYNRRKNKLSQNGKIQMPEIWNRLKPPKPSRVLDTYWKFAAERQEIFFKRFRGDNPPFTQDAILQKYKFTNVYRASDRVSQYLIGKVIYNGNYSPEDMFFRIMLFKIFNKIETWELLEDSFGEIRVVPCHNKCT